MADRALGDHLRRLRIGDGDAVQPLLGAEPEVEFLHRRIGGNAMALSRRGDEAGRRQHLETLVDTDEELRRNGGPLDGAEWPAFDLPRDRAELARRINLDLDAAAGILLDGGGVSSGIEIKRRI